MLYVTTISAPFYWTNSCVADKTVPPMAVPMGFDHQGHPIYVGRAHFNNELTPAHVVPAKRLAYVPHNGKEHCVENYQVSCILYFSEFRLHRFFIAVMYKSKMGVSSWGKSTSRGGTSWAQ